MTHPIHPPAVKMGIPIPNSKLGMWLFLGTEIMFFTAFIGTYIVLRFGAVAWPAPHDVHLSEPIGAFNTFVLICSSVTVVLEDEIDVGRGDMIARASEAPAASRELQATLCWLGDAPARPGATYLLKHTTRTVRAKLDAIEDRLDVTTLERAPADELELNAIGRVRLRLGGELAVDPYAVSRATGAFILIDEGTNDTVGAGMVAS